MAAPVEDSLIPFPSAFPIKVMGEQVDLSLIHI